MTVIESMESRPGGAPEEELTAMRLLAQGLTDHQIARRLGISVITVRRRVQRFCRRVGALSRVQAMATAVARGWVVPEADERGE